MQGKSDEVFTFAVNRMLMRFPMGLFPPATR